MKKIKYTRFYRKDVIIKMEKIKEFIKEKKLILPGEVIGVGVSGGSDSMALLHYLNEIKEELDFEVVAIHINHGIREESRDEERFVMEKCQEMGVRAYKFKINSPSIAKERGESLETAAREGRYEVFKSLIQRGVIDKIALAHHESDQAETILMHIFRGSGIAGARGMEPIRDGIYIRPMLNVSKKEIMSYIHENNIDYVQDNSNNDIEYNRNFLRNVILPQICERWPGAEAGIVSFGRIVSEDDDYINKYVNDDGVIYNDDVAKIPLTYFSYPVSVLNRLLIKIFKKVGIKKDFEKKHIELIRELAKNGSNGGKIQLPYEVTAVKEYDYLTLCNKLMNRPELRAVFEVGEIEIPNMGKIITKRVRTLENNKNLLFVDENKIPEDAIWRYREDGDVFTKFGGGSKKLKSYFIDKKIPQRIRDYIPVLASGNEILVIGGIEISDNVKIEENSKILSISIKLKK